MPEEVLEWRCISVKVPREADTKTGMDVQNFIERIPVKDKRKEGGQGRRAFSP